MGAELKVGIPSDDYLGTARAQVLGRESREAIWTEL